MENVKKAEENENSIMENVTKAEENENGIMENVKKTKEEKEEEAGNRIINYYVIRELWKLAKRKVDKMYDELGITKPRYTRILQGKQVKLGKDSIKLEELTGVNKKYFCGEKAFNIEMSSEDIKKYINARIELYKINRKKDEDTFEEIEIETEIDIDMSKKIAEYKNTQKRFETRLNKKLSKIDTEIYTANYDYQIFCILYYFKNNEMYKKNGVVLDMFKVLKSMTVNDLEYIYEIDKGKTLQEYIISLKEKTALAIATSTYLENKRKLKE